MNRSGSIAAGTAPELNANLCAQCGIPLDAKYFDESSVQPPPAAGHVLVLARFELPPQYCGVLEYFSQFTDAWARDNTRVRTPSLEWAILANKRPLYPYMQLNRIVNPWGFGSFPVSARLEDSATVEFVVRGVTPRMDDPEVAADATPAPVRVGGRIVGRYWYNAAFGDVVRRS
ncbi:MAG: hypothetical protein LAN84_08465 [Acidobacteriia bacterium]|nr:hypothetical protein [Terriglobia bacterium]